MIDLSISVLLRAAWDLAMFLLDKELPRKVSTWQVVDIPCGLPDSRYTI